MHADVRFPRLLALLALAANLAHAFYIPGWSIKSYADGETIPLFVNKVYSDNTQLQYAYAELPFVCPSTGRRSAGASGATLSLNLGEILRGDRIILSDYELVMGVDEEARYLCSTKVDRRGLERAKEIVKDGYVAEWIVDNLPGATSFVTTDKSRKYYAAGFKMGYEDFDSATGKPRYYINNHVTLVIRHRTAPGRDGENGKKVIVGFEVYTKSIEASNRDRNGIPKDLHNVEKGLELHITPNNTDLQTRYADSSYVPDEEDIDDDATLTIPYTYSVYFREDDKLEWQNRWDMYFVNQEDSHKIHWIAIINSLLISAILTATVAVIFTRTVRGDIKGSSDIEKPKINRPKTTKSPRKSAEKGGLLGQVDDDDGDADISSDDEPLEDITGWKLLHGDVFRAPAYGGLLAPLVGSGSQLVFMATGLLLLSAFGILNPSFRGGFISVGLALFIFAGILSGYFSARVYKTFGGQRWQKNVVVTGTLIPGLLFATIFILNLFVWAQASSTAIPFGTLIALLVLWLLVQLPLVYVGSWYGFEKVGPWTHPVKTNAIPRQIPPQMWYMKGIQFALLAGLLPFAVIFIELLFVFKSLWQDKSGYYYVYGFLAAVCLILFITVVEVTIVATYNQLCSENYHWWWQSFFVGGGSALWVFLACTWYYVFKLHITGFVSSMLFFAYSFLACLVYGLLTGTIGFLAAYAFVRRIYGAIKAD
ncbi:Nonaspanin (TM9SF) [Neofusicoccum parvum]|uniref:Nonaspanin (TM9SF) n=1 Tax=Neofusicoccum parvum TaxID=310453 RepID=A0ACB5S4E6_9PEZI|nr:Nonaspanin (TM9SF) [Neofusicoccum parvum]